MYLIRHVVVINAPRGVNKNSALKQLRFFLFLGKKGRFWGIKYSRVSARVRWVSVDGVVSNPSFHGVLFIWSGREFFFKYKLVA